MSSSGLTDLSSSLSSDDSIAPISKGKLENYFTHGSDATPTSPPAKKKRPSSPPHEYVLADNPDVGFLCIFRSRFSDVFPKSLAQFGPQDIEKGVIEPIPDELVERLLCALLGLLLNRKKDIERGHYTRALEEAVQTHTSQWPLAWQGKNPLHGGGNFNKMTPEERLTLLKALVIWSLESSEAVKSVIKESYKQSRHDDDLNQPLSVQPWGKDGDKRRFWLIEGQDDTHFRLYRESNPALKQNTWRSVAGTIDELRNVAQRLDEENTQASRRLRDRIYAGIPRFEASEEKRKRRDYRLARKAQFVRPVPGFSLYEGRTRGKRLKYTYSDEDDEGSDALSARRSRQQSGISTPAEPSGPTFTASGRQVRSSRQMLSGQQVITERPNLRGLDGAHDDELRPESRGRPRRIAQQNGVESVPRSRRYTKGYNSLDSMDEESDATSSGREWADGDDEELDDRMDDEDEEVETSDNEVFEGEGASVQQSLMVSLRYKKSSLSHPSQNVPKGRLISEDRSDLPDILTDTTHMPGVEPLDKPVPSHYTEAKQSQPSGNSSSESALHASKVQNGDGFSPKNEANTSSAPSESKLVAGVPIGNHL